MGMGTEITPVKMLEMAKNGWDAIIEMYKHSDKEQRDKIIKALSSLVGFGALLKFLKNL